MERPALFNMACNRSVKAVTFKDKEVSTWSTTEKMEREKKSKEVVRVNRKFPAATSSLEDHKSTEEVVRRDNTMAEERVEVISTKDV